MRLARRLVEGLTAEGPCACPACYVHGCDYCASVGCCRHLDGTPWFVPPTATPVPVFGKFR